MATQNHALAARGVLFAVTAIFLCWNLRTNASDASEEAFELDAFQVVSTATRTQRLAKEVPIRTEILAPELFQSAATRDLGSAIEYLPGIRSEANCQNCGTAEIKMLGLGHGYNQLLFDSQPLFSGLASVYGIDQIPTAFVERIEVVKGGASSLYGPGAVAGVINILPKEPVKTSGRYDVSFESVDGNPFFSSVGLFNWSSENGDMAASLYGQYNDSDSVDLNDDGFSEITEKEFYTLGINAWAYPTESGKITFNYSYSWEKRRGGNRFELLPHESQITEQLEHNWHRGGVAWEQGNGSGLTYRLAASFSYVDRVSYYGGVGDVTLPGKDGYDPLAYEEAIEASKLLYGYSDTIRYYFDSLFSSSHGDHYLSWGAQYQIDDVFDEKRDSLDRSLKSDGSLASSLGEDPIADDDYTDIGLFVQDEWMPAQNVTVIAGLRADKHSELEDWAVSPRLALRYASSEDWTWRGSLATGFRAPEIFDEDFHIEILDDPTRTRNAPDLKEETSTSYAGGFIWTPSKFDGKLQADVELFSTKIRDTFHVSDRVFTDADGSAFKQRINASGSSVSGFEANAAYRFSDRWQGEIGVTHVDATFDEAQEVLPGIFERSYLESPEWTGVAQLSYDNDELFDFFLGVIYTGPMIAAREVEGTLNRATDSFFVVDVTLVKHMDIEFSDTNLHFDITLGVKNLFDQRQKDLTSGPNRDTTYFYGPRFPRSIVAKANLSW